MKVIEYVGGIKKYSWNIGMGISLELILNGKLSQIVINNR